MIRRSLLAVAVLLLFLVPAMSAWAMPADFTTAEVSQHPNGMVSDGATIWTGDQVDDKVYAYRVATGARDESKEFSLAKENNFPISLWMNVDEQQENIYVLDSELGHQRIYVYSTSAYTLSVQSATGPEMVKGLVADPGNTTVDLTWDEPDSSQGITSFQYRIMMEDVGIPWPDDNIGWEDVPNSGANGANRTSYTVTALENGTLHRFAVRAVNSGDDSGIPSYPVEMTPGQPDKIETLAAAAGPCQVTLSWTPPTNNGAAIGEYQYAMAEGYQGRYSPWRSISGDTTESNGKRSYTVTGLYAGMLYRFSVRAVNEHGKAESSNPVTKRPAEACGPPINYDLTAIAGDRQVTLAWTAPDDNDAPIIKKFQYRKKTGDAQWDDERDRWGDIPERSEGKANRTGYIVPGLTNYTPYRFQVRAIYSIGSANVSDEATATPWLQTPPVFEEGEAATRSVAENTAASADIGSPVTATDEDGETLTYSLETRTETPYWEEGFGQ